VAVAHIASDFVPMNAQSVRTLAVEAWRRAEAMGLVEPDARRLGADDVARLVDRVREAGLARGQALRFDNVSVPSVEEVETLLQVVIAALEASPVARSEWPAVSRVLEQEQLASLLDISVSSLRRYLSGERGTPDSVAARLHHIALIVGDLSGAYNEVGIRRWFERPRSALDGKRPADLLKGGWSPDDPAPQRVRNLARALVALSAT
jgi:transcriptional regulator with XRE-family HTH domain